MGNGKDWLASKVAFWRLVQGPVGKCPRAELLLVSYSMA